MEERRAVRIGWIQLDSLILKPGKLQNLLNQAGQPNGLPVERVQVFLLGLLVISWIWTALLLSLTTLIIPLLVLWLCCYGALLLIAEVLKELKRMLKAWLLGLMQRKREKTK